MSKAEKDFCKKCYQKDNCGYISRNLEHKCPTFQSFEEAEEKSMDIWKDAQGDDLPPIDREVIALREIVEGRYKVCYAHRLDTKRCVTITTPAGNIEDVPIATYGKGNWNIGEIKWWLDLKLPYEELEGNGESLCNPYKEIINELYETYKKKNADYGNSFADTIEEFGFIPAVARISDKVNRMKNIVKGQKMNVKDESFRDALMDTANYCIMTIMEIDNDNDDR